MKKGLFSKTIAFSLQVLQLLDGKDLPATWAGSGTVGLSPKQPGLYARAVKNVPTVRIGRPGSLFSHFVVTEADYTGSDDIACT
jgi:hypothetical protein